ncbi:hypothetical protein CF326_g7054 [Tilletia indica]|nr:hypothetical protein CF326_g7054 [Tilletia indica]
MRVKATRANHMSADRKRFDAKQYHTPDERNFLSDALRDNLYQIMAEESASNAVRSPQATAGPSTSQGTVSAGPSNSQGASQESQSPSGQVGGITGRDSADALDDPEGGMPDGVGPAGGNEQEHDVGGAGPDAEENDEPPSLRERFDFFRQEALYGLRGEDGESDSDVSSDEDMGELDRRRGLERHVGRAKLRQLLDADFPVRNRNNDRPTQDPVRTFLTDAEIDTLEHYHCWMLTSGTTEAFELHAMSHRRKGTPIPSLHVTRKLSTIQTDGLDFEVYDMCPGSCVAFLGQNAELDRCPECNRSRYDASGNRSVKKFRYIPFLPRIQAMYGNPDIADQLRYRSDRVKAVDRRTGCGEHTTHRFSDLHDGCEAAGQAKHCQDDRDCVVAITTDGSQLIPNRKASTGWMVLIQILNLPPSDRFAIKNHHFSLIVPGPGQPKDLESFLWPLCAELAHLQEEGAWTWDGAKKEWFLLRVLLGGVYADQKGSVKLSMHVGGNGARGCRFCEIRAVFADNDGSNAYFPLRPMVTHTDRNQGRPSYDPLKLPHRTKAGYNEGIDAARGLRGRRLADVVRQTGMTALPLVAFSRLFGSPYFFPIDPFHLLHLNVPGNVWKAWKTLGASPDTPFGLSDTQRQSLGLFIADNESRYPSSFMSKAPRDIHLYGKTNYRAVEWAAVFHHFVPPFLHEIGAPAQILQMISTYIQAVDMTLSRDGLTASEIETVRHKFASFVKTWESIYASTDDGLKWMTISVHQILHVADQLIALGSVKATSQASCERYLGSVKKNLRQYRFPYRVVENRALQKTRMFILGTHHQELPAWITDDFNPMEKKQADKKRVEGLGTVIRSSSHRPLTDVEQRAETSALAQVPGDLLYKRRYGRMTLSSGDIVRSKRVEPDEFRCASNVALINPVTKRISFGEAVEFLFIETTEGRWDTALVRLFAVTETFPTFSVGQWSDDYELVDVGHITEVVGVLRSGIHNYVVRKRAWQASENGIEDTNDAQENGTGEPDGRQTEDLDGEEEDDDDDSSGGSSSDE